MVTEKQSCIDFLSRPTVRLISRTISCTDKGLTFSMVAADDSVGDELKMACKEIRTERKRSKIKR